MGENIGQKKKTNNSHQKVTGKKKIYTPDARYVYTKLCSDLKSLKAITTTKLKIAEDQKFQKVVRPGLSVLNKNIIIIKSNT